MKNSKVRVLLLLAFAASYALAAYSENLKGRIGSSSQWDSGWIDLAPVKDFRKGNKLRLTVGGTAKKIVVRLLAKGDDPNDPIGIVETDLPVPKSRIVIIALKEDHPQTAQISVHGGTNPWNKYPLGGGNGPATLQKAEQVAP